MATKNISTRLQICGRSEKCHGGHSAVEQSSYIGREKMYCEYEGKIKYPKYTEDLVHNEVMLPENAPKEYMDPAVLWNSVENAEKGDKAQLARTFRVELPNEWSYELAIDVMRQFIKKNFVDKGMCVQFAIHDSENKKTGQRNLHCHMLITMRGIDDQGKWLPKQKKVYLKDANGEKIPIIDIKTGKQKTDSRNRKLWKCTTVSANDWGNRENAKKWRKDLVNTINEVNEKIGMTENKWEYRSFKEQGLDIFPQIHLGAKASALERAGIHTEKGDINRDIIERNKLISLARDKLEKAREELKELSSVSARTVISIKNEIIDVIRKISGRNHDRLKLPIVNKKYIARVSNRELLQNKDYIEKFVSSNGWNTFEDMKKVYDELKGKADFYESDIGQKTGRIDYLHSLIDMYSEYEPYVKYNKQRYALKGFARKKYEREHVAELASYGFYRGRLKSMIRENDKRILPSKWKAELNELQDQCSAIRGPLMDTTWKLAVIDVLNYNRKELERMTENEKHDKNKDRVFCLERRSR